MRRKMPKLTYVLRYMEAGYIQKKTGVPASVISRVKSKKASLSQKSRMKLNVLYDTFWIDRMKKTGFREDEAKTNINLHIPVKEMRREAKENREIATQIRNRRRERDKGNPNYKKSWHTTKQILEQMSRDITRTREDWKKIAREGSKPKTYRKERKEKPVTIERILKDTGIKWSEIPEEDIQDDFDEFFPEDEDEDTD